MIIVKKLVLSVHDIVDFVFSEGDITTLAKDRYNLRDGMIIHQTIEKRKGAQSEVFVRLNTTVRDYDLEISGRIDIVEELSNHYHLIEIKSTSKIDDYEDEPQKAHLAQNLFYGYMFYHYKKIDKNLPLQISVLYVDRYTFLEKLFTKEYSYEELETFFYEVINKYLDFLDLIEEFQEVKFQSLKNLRFPYANLRSGQRELMDSVSEVIKDKGTLFVCAPTGIGKSLGTLYPALTSLPTKDTKIFYLTAKSMIKEVARDTINLLRKRSKLKIKSLVMTAKEKICINDCVKCNPKDCPYAKDFYKKVNQAVVDIYTHEDDFNYDSIVHYAYKYEICPFEYQLTLSLYSDCIICDYNYVFDLRVYLRRFFEYDTSNIILLIDEAHNMYDRVCGMYTISLNFNILNTIYQHINNEEIRNSVNSLIVTLKQYETDLSLRKKDALKFLDLDMSIIDNIESLLDKLEKHFDILHNQGEEINEELWDCYYELSNFLKIAAVYSSDFFVWVTKNKEEVNYQITCVNPRALIKNRTSKVLSTVFFSATLHPLDYYISLYGGDETSRTLFLPSPFKQENLALYVNPYISTKYNNRDNTKYKIAYQIHDVIKHGGKYLVYFPSYQYLEMVFQVFKKINETDLLLLKQTSDMTEVEKNNFIKQFDDSNTNIVGFAVLGGQFAEGIDLKGEKLNGVIIVGVGLPTFDAFREELRAYFDAVYHKGYQYAYIYPGFNKVLQAVGRVIRDENDKGIAVLIDERYIKSEYLKLFPPHWRHYQIIDW